MEKIDYEVDDFLEKSMYKHGLYEGLKLIIIEGMKKIDIKK